jgi:CheY-like chemotaxis protein
MKRNSSGTQSAQALHYLPLPFLFASIVIISFISVSLRSGATERDLCRGVVVNAAAEMQSAIIGVLEEASVLSSALESNPSLAKSSVATIAMKLLEKYPFITGVSTAPSAIIQYHFPETAGTGTIGHDLLTNPERRDTLVEAVARKSYVLSGPFDDIDDRLVLFARFPVFVSNSLWGFTSLSIDFEKMMGAFDFGGRYPGFAYAVSAIAGNGESSASAGEDGAFLIGDMAAFEKGLKSDVLKLPGSRLVFHMIPSRGWSGSDPWLLILLIAGLAGSFFLLAALYLRLPVRALQRTAASAPLAEAVRDLRAARERADSEASPSTEHTQPFSRPKLPSVPLEAARVAVADDPLPVDAPQAAGNGNRASQGTTFKGADVKGKLYMPDVLFSGDPATFAERFGLKGASPGEREEDDDDEEGSFIAPSSEKAPVPKAEAVPEPPPGASQEPAPVPVPPPKPSILVVDDSDANRDIMGRMLALRGHAADFAASGEDAVAACTARQYDIVFMDCFMPGMDGYRTASLLRADPLSSHALIIGMSARTGIQELQRCRDAGMNDLMAKPFTLTQVMGYLERSSLS